jgi:hypothetical protein
MDQDVDALATLPAEVAKQASHGVGMALIEHIGERAAHDVTR